MECAPVPVLRAQLRHTSGTCSSLPCKPHTLHGCALEPEKIASWHLSSQTSKAMSNYGKLDSLFKTEVANSIESNQKGKSKFLLQHCWSSLFNPHQVLLSKMFLMLRFCWLLTSTLTQASVHSPPTCTHLSPSLLGKGSWHECVRELHAKQPFKSTTVLVCSLQSGPDEGTSS